VVNNRRGWVDIRGKQYKTIALRVEEFRKSCPASEGWAIVTEFPTLNSESVVCRAAVVNPDGVTVATGHAQETWKGSINSTSAVENCETSAIGRALAAFGLGGEEFASAEEVTRAIGQQQAGHTNRPVSKTTQIVSSIEKETNVERMGRFTGRVDELAEAGELDEDEAKLCRMAIAKRTAALVSASNGHAVAAN
jgi:hypothetical protein